MLRPLLLLCWAATIVSAGDPENVNPNDTRISINSTSYNAATNPQSMLQPEVNEEIKMHSISSKNENTLNNSISKTLIPSTIISTMSTTPLTTTTTSSTTTKSTTSTPAPITTAVPTTSTSTTPLPPPSTGKWIVKENNTICILIKMAVQFNVSYTIDNVTIYKVMDVPSNGNATGKCDKTEQNLTLSWESQNNTTQDNFTIHFVKNETEKYYSLHHFEISLAAEEFPNNKSNKTVTVVHVTPQFKTGLSNSYKCIKEQQLNLTHNNVTVGFLKITNLQFQAFRGDNTTIFGLAKDCSFDTPDIVPITVGCALAGLVVIVLIAYLVGRRRSQARGYLSM
ncbi:Lysosome-associated membrane glycoprotein 1 [Trachymyrmex septentrionalis]|uniref:Lysosome-associated membrane glycoprotein 5 n=1 Tax=Trachymyrmex septentrionalis TaxID=34720 RepID=A0A151JZ13_9HYME|nr:PREDICTED: lysosome-associated membrane glycoprotein 1 [Trachymyrmex septentrionalis]KYN41617.1 Lysosome-associated membrane glycoprotein 1 [Trachymyrmex septentrionalis]